MKINSRIPNTGTSIFATMGQLAVKHNAVNLAQGFPNFGTSRELQELVNKAIKDGHNQYAPLAGIFSLREQISKKMQALYQRTYNPETEITVTAGATQALYTAITSFVLPGDEVIIFKPAYDCYEPSVKINGGIPVSVQMKAENYKVDWDEVKQKISSKTKMIIINTPHNPSGTVFTKEDMQQLSHLVKDTNIVILSDEVYEHIIFDDLEHQSVARFPELAERSLICASFGKTFHNTGWKMGYCAAPKELMKAFKKIHQFQVFCVNHPIQIAFAEFLKEPENYLNLSSFYQQKRDFFLSKIQDSRFKFTPSEGTYFQILDYSEISEEDDMNFAQKLIEDYQIASIPISPFDVGGQKTTQLRFCFAKSEETLEKAGKILSSI